MKKQSWHILIFLSIINLFSGFTVYILLFLLAYIISGIEFFANGGNSFAILLMPIIFAGVLVPLFFIIQIFLYNYIVQKKNLISVNSLIRFLITLIVSFISGSFGIIAIIMIMTWILFYGSY